MSTELAGGRYEGIYEIGEDEYECSLQFVFGCPKEKRHKEYIPANVFSYQDLPERYRDINLFQLIQVISFLTVKVTVQYTSLNRPQHVQNTNRPYPFGAERGNSKTRVGTGRIGTVWKFGEADGRSCPCTECQRSDNPKKTWGLIRVITAVHVVYDTSEAVQSTCRFGFNDSCSPEVVFQGVDMERADVNDDRCHLSCVTHNVALIDSLKGQWSRYTTLHKKVMGRFRSPEDRLVAVVSHPHGCSKQISLGEWTHRDVTGESSPGHPFVKYTYTTATCRGSSGATVYIMGRSWALWYNQIHSGFNDHEQYNFSGNGCD
ncbi:hypothetical protein Bpfe_002659 [Biomphalaria pfeifferi]|uniref:Peptidase S1 domain-containing protein n=1 Tax=Biomphalaria pfeifferi TaxID=112525 RepID=A0AAD8FL04_BIOPF|nr:hypothetical protein Bpfe_002659 [Biomphalaria pfeifferi]